MKEYLKTVLPQRFPVSDTEFEGGNRNVLTFFDRIILINKQVTYKKKRFICK
jgi:hypothetical protein